MIFKLNLGARIYIKLIIGIVFVFIFYSCDNQPQTQIHRRLIDDPTQRVEFDGGSILPPRAKGWFRLEPPPPLKPPYNKYNLRIYFIKELKDEVKSPYDLHRLTAVLRIMNVKNIKTKNHIDALKNIAKGFSSETYLDKCFGQDCLRYQSTREQLNPRFPDSVFLLSKRGSMFFHPDSTIIVTIEYRQYYAKGAKPLSSEDLESEVEPFQNSLEFSPMLSTTQTPTQSLLSSQKTQNGAKYFFNRGIACYEKGQLDQAISNYSKCIELNPKKSKLTKAYYNRGLAHHDKGDYEKAILDYTKAIKLNPKHFRAYNNRGNAYREKGHYDKAIPDYNKAIEIYPRRALVYCNRGNAYARKNEFVQAISDFNKAINLDPKDAIAYSNRGRVYAQKGQYDKAISDYTKTIELNPDAFAYNRLAWLLATCPEGRYRNSVKAIEYAKKAVALKRISAYLDTLAAAYAENGDFTNAVKAEKEAVRLCKDPNSKNEFQELVDAYQSKKTYVQFKNIN